MKRAIACVIVGLVMLGAVGAATAAPQRWVPGTSYYISETDANDFLEQAVDSAYCDGIARFGKKGEFPYEEYKVFDCSIERDDLYCSDWRWKAVKGSHYGNFRLKSVRQPDPDRDCF